MMKKIRYSVETWLLGFVPKNYRLPSIRVVFHHYVRQLSDLSWVINSLATYKHKFNLGKRYLPLRQKWVIKNNVTLDAPI